MCYSVGMATAEVYKSFQGTLMAMDKWLHLALLLGDIAIDHGADPSEVDRLIRADKGTIDKLLLERLKERDNAA